MEAEAEVVVVLPTASTVAVLYSVLAVVLAVRT